MQESDPEGAALDVGAGHRPRPDGAHVGNSPFAGEGWGKSSPWAPRREHLLLRFGAFAWALLGIVGVLVVGWLLATRLAVVVVPMLLALFPAALLAPAVNWLNRHWVPRPLATVLAVVAAVAVVGGIFALIVPVFLAQLPRLPIRCPAQDSG